MRVEYFPGVDSQGRKIRDFACAVKLPDSFPGASTKKWKWGIICHGMGERSDGRQSHLEQLAVKGFDWNNDGVADSFFISEDMKKAVDLHETIIVVPTYSNFFEPETVNRIYDHIIANFQGQGTFLFEGFSLGGQAVFKYISSSEGNAKRVHLAVPVAAPYGLVSAATAAKYGPVIHAFSNDKDDRVSSSNTTKQISDINGQNPVVKAQYTLFRVDGHGGDKEAMALTPPKAPGGQGVIDAAETIWQLNDAIVAGTRRQIKTGTIPTPAPAPSPTPSLLTANFNLSDGQEINTTVFEMDASASTGVKTDWEGYKWDVKPVGPAAGKQYGVRPDGSYGGPKKKLIDIVDGQYEIILTVKSVTGSTATKKVIVTAKIGVAKTLTGFDSSTDIATYSDGSTEKATAVLANGKWVIKNSSGQLIS
jgi:hypothetical protein